MADQVAFALHSIATMENRSGVLGWTYDAANYVDRLER